MFMGWTLLGRLRFLPANQCGLLVHGTTAVTLLFGLAAPRPSRPLGHAPLSGYATTPLFSWPLVAARRGGHFYVTPHYAGSQMLLVRLATVDPEDLRDLLVQALLSLAPKRLTALL